MDELSESFELLHFMMDEKTKEVESMEDIVKLVRRYQTVRTFGRPYTTGKIAEKAV